MFKKFLTAIAAAAALCATAQAQSITNAGFETGTTANWNSNPTLSAVTGYVVDVNLVNPTQGDIDNCPACSVITPVAGNYFGLFLPVDLDNPGAQAPYVPNPSTSSGVYTTSVWNFGSGNTIAPPETIWLRLITGDIASNLGAIYNDSVTVAFSGVGTTVGIQGQYMSTIDSGWIGFAVPTGATGLQINVNDFYGAGIGNSPIVAIDYSLSAIPEPTTVMMMLAGLGALGFKGRRAAGAKRANAIAA